MTNDLYDSDFHAWANQQAALLRAGRLGDADIQNIAEEIESLGRSEKRELVSLLSGLLLHLLKWVHQPDLRFTSLRLTIEEQRASLRDHLADNPSLGAQVIDAERSAYRSARNRATIETGLPRGVFPEACPFSFDDAMNDDFWPDGAAA